MPLCKKFGVGLAILLSGLLVVACTPGDGSAPGAGDTFDPGLTEDQFVAEYRARAAKLTLPQGAGWPVWVPVGIREYNPHSGEYEAATAATGQGKADADFWWFCKWAEEWLSIRGKDIPRETEALRVMKTVDETDFFKVLDDGGRQMVDGILTKAVLGDATPLDRFVDLNCVGGFPSPAPPGALPEKSPPTAPR